MLSKTDLGKIQTIIRNEIENESSSIRDDLAAEIKLSRMEIQKEIRALAERIKNLEIVVRKIQKDIKVIVNFFDKEYLDLQKRLEAIEKQLRLFPVQ